MDLVTEFRRHAQDCRRMADLSRNKEGRNYWNGLAERWLRCADNLEREELRPAEPERHSRRAARKDGRIAGRRQQSPSRAPLGWGLLF
jgi:hypothetical protein